MNFKHFSFVENTQSIVSVASTRKPLREEDDFWIRGADFYFVFYFLLLLCILSWLAYRVIHWLSALLMLTEHVVSQWPCSQGPLVTILHGPLSWNIHCCALCACPPVCAMDSCFLQPLLWTWRILGLAGLLRPSAHLPQFVCAPGSSVSMGPLYMETTGSNSPTKVPAYTYSFRNLG